MLSNLLFPERHAPFYLKDIFSLHADVFSLLQCYAKKITQAFNILNRWAQYFGLFLLPLRTSQEKAALNRKPILLYAILNDRYILHSLTLFPQQRASLKNKKCLTMQGYLQASRTHLKEKVFFSF